MSAIPGDIQKSAAWIAGHVLDLRKEQGLKLIGLIQDELMNERSRSVAEIAATECSCSPTECCAAPAPAPFLTPSIRTQWCALFIGLTLIGSVVAYAALASADEAFRKQQLDSQEITWRR